MTIVRFVALQAGWLVSVLGGAAGRPWDGPLLVGALAVVAVSAAPAGTRAGLLHTLAIATLVGATFDGALAAAGVLQFPAGSPGWPIPVWMIALWINFALALDALAGVLGSSPARAAAAGAVGGPASYLAGARLGAVSLLPSMPAAAVLVAIEWAIALPLLIAIHARSVARRHTREAAA